MRFVKLQLKTICMVTECLIVVYREARCPNLSAPDYGSSGPGSRPVRGAALCSWARHFALIVALPTQVLLLWGNPAMD